MTVEVILAAKDAAIAELEEARNALMAEAEEAKQAIFAEAEETKVAAIAEALEITPFEGLEGLSAQQNRAGGGAQQRGQAAQQGRLARTVGAC